jgi:hypothetical protein
MSGSMRGVWKRSYGEALRHRQPKAADTAKPHLSPPRHIPRQPGGSQVPSDECGNHAGGQHAGQGAVAFREFAISESGDNLSPGARKMTGAANNEAPSVWTKASAATSPTKAGG